MNVIEIENLSKTFRGKRRALVQALQSMSLTIDQGETFGFLGPNGAGKSTTIKIIMGLIRPTTGIARLMGMDASHSAARAKVGFLPENPAFYDFLTAEEYLRFVARIFGLSGKALNQQLERVLSLLDLQEARRRPIRGYSKGMVQRLGLAQALIHDPEVLILDEPMSGLDPVGRALVKQVLLELRSQGKTIFFSTHITSDVEVICDRVGVIVKGKMQAIERVEDVLLRQTSGYDIHVCHPRTGLHKTVFSEAKTLPEIIVSSRDEGFEVIKLEPRRQNLESFFLDIVKSNHE
ncbi:MAG: ABC transporter ATP-binding protein [Gammaproteobacteria bacterium]|nr:MAG: ABC transporter ATP-binding protein [Gammaproteobacteria bacterium]